LGCVITCITLGAPAAEIAQSRNTQNSIANRLNNKQLSEIKGEQFSPAAVGSPKSARLDTNFTEIGILFLRGDGGDPKELRVDDSTLMYITGRTGEGRTYQNGREIEIPWAVKESAGQIAMQQFLAPAGAKLLIKELPAMAQESLTRFAEGRFTPRLMFARITSREDTARVSEIRAKKIQVMAASLSAAHPRDMLELVRTAMRTFGFKSDACDGSSDLRCDQPGVREAFAQIKREEALQLTSVTR
ncbi:MAG TPA: hypothetical protein VFE89_18875, partial [Beijerinckiaceae bacterium]|nr:hypothetical protein [Beijerinckiaceae bacterium]